MRPKNLKVIIGVGLLVVCLNSAAWSKNPMMFGTGKKKAAATSPENISLPKDLNAADIDRFMAGLSDEQVRRLLINELKDRAQQEAQATADAAKPSGFAASAVA